MEVAWKMQSHTERFLKTTFLSALRDLSLALSQVSVLVIRLKIEFFS
jgi:hypothetical protein